jgi:hypothetical protein
MMCVVETAMGTPVHAQEDVESTYVSAVYGWVGNMCEQMLAQFISQKKYLLPRIFSRRETTSTHTVVTAACQVYLPSCNIEVFCLLG